MWKLAAILILLVNFSAEAQTSSEWKSNAAIYGQYTTTGVETSITAGKCMAPIIHFTNVFPTAAGGKLVHISSYYGPGATGEATQSYAIWDRQPSVTAINSCFENNTLTVTIQDVLYSVVATNTANCAVVPPTVGAWGCGTTSYEVNSVSPAEPHNTDLWIALISINVFQPPTVPGTIFGFRLDTRY